ncbi:unnamed protein product [Clavelina lepadiformis]|uniref:Uncharacterized protein n=1 Tax=Clavelina lepadiformis TaxID=159417 RepID=A0ABP0GRR7_CLALP
MAFLLYILFIITIHSTLLSALKSDEARQNISQTVSEAVDAGNAECRDYHSLHNSSLWCEFVTTTEDCAMDEGFINYIKVAFCDNPPKYVPLIGIGYALWLLFLFVGLGTTAGGFFCPAVEFIAHNLKMHPHIAISFCNTLL